MSPYVDAIIGQAVCKVRRLVINQVRYQLPCDLIPKNDPDSWYLKADEMTDEQTYEFIKDKDIISTPFLIQLVAEVGLETLYDEDNVDAVSDYIVNHYDDCAELYQYLLMPGA